MLLFSDVWMWSKPVTDTRTGAKPYKVESIHTWKITTEAIGTAPQVSSR